MEQQSLKDKTKDWLNAQGYPTEFQVANICQARGFRVWQGSHVSDTDENILREIDVLAMSDILGGEYLIRVCHVLECKWSKDKPWVVLSSRHGHMANAACIAQTIGNSLGSAALWVLAGDPELQKMDIFSTPKRPGFGGRQAFSKGADLFYSAMQSVTDVSTLLMRRYDDHPRQVGEVPRNTVLALPIIVVDGIIFEAFFDEEADEMEIQEVKRVRCHWRGARSWRLHATIDVVALDALDDFLSVRADEAKQLLSRLDHTRNAIARCFEDKSLEHLPVARGSRGVIGLPPLLREAVTRPDPSPEERRD